MNFLTLSLYFLLYCAWICCVEKVFEKPNSPPSWEFFSFKHSLYFLKHIFIIFNLLIIKNSQVKKASLIISYRKNFIFGKRFNFQIQCRILDLGCTKGFLIAQVVYLRVNLPSLRETLKNLIFNGRGKDWNCFSIY